MYDNLLKTSEGEMAEAELYFLFICADRKLYRKEQESFKEICMQLGITQQEVKDISERCKREIKNRDSVFDVICERNLDEKVERDEYSVMGEKKSKAELARILWNLVNLGYSDTKYTDEEKNIVDYLLHRWKIDKTVYREFIDIAETMVALEKYRDWVDTTVRDESLRKQKVIETDKKMEKLFGDVKNTIEELAM